MLPTGNAGLRDRKRPLVLYAAARQWIATACMADLTNRYRRQPHRRHAAQGLYRGGAELHSGYGARRGLGYHPSGGIAAVEDVLDGPDPVH